MPRIPSANPDFRKRESISSDSAYKHGADSRKSFIPMAFQVTSPFDRRTLLLPHALVMHVNPSDLNETHTKKIEKIKTRGGFVEQHWPDELSELSASGSTGAFINIYTGLTSVLRQRTIAWDRYRDLQDLYYNNGSLHDPYGNIVLQGLILLMYDKGLYYGSFRNFKVEETAEAPYSFRLDWTFKVEHTVQQVTGFGFSQGAPAFQSQNTAKDQVEVPITQTKYEAPSGK